MEKKVRLAALLMAAVVANAIPVSKQVECLAKNIYFEARNSNLADQAAVSDVVINRVESSRYPNTVCKVVHQRRSYRKCQFSWYCDGKSDKPKDEDAWQKATLVAFQVYHYDLFRGISEGATMYHAKYVKPFWAKHFQLVGTIGKHKYYRSHRMRHKLNELVY